MGFIEDIIKIPFDFVEMMFREGWVIFVLIGLAGGIIYFLFWM